MRVYRPGSTVWLCGATEARVLSATIHPGGHVTYEVAYWSAGSRTQLTVEAWEVEPRESDRFVRMGLLNGHT